MFGYYKSPSIVVSMTSNLIMATVIKDQAVVSSPDAGDDLSTAQEGNPTVEISTSIFPQAVPFLFANPLPQFDAGMSLLQRVDPKLSSTFGGRFALLSASHEEDLNPTPSEARDSHLQLQHVAEKASHLMA